MRPALICETVTGGTMPELVVARDAVASADMVELRLDGVNDLDVAGAIRGRQLPVVVTCRPAWEGGLFTGEEDQRRRILAEALEAGADYVDVEWKAGFDDLVRGHAARVVLSSHDFAGGTEEVVKRTQLLRAGGAAVIKVAITARRLCDALPLMEAAAGGDAVVVAMGDAGVPSRLLASRFGARWTYAGAAVAPGQIPASRMVEEFRFRTIGPATALFGVVGANAARSRLPAAINKAFAAAAMDAVCVPLCAADADDLKTFTETLGFAGVIQDGLPQDETERQLREWTGLRCA